MKRNKRAVSASGEDGANGLQERAVQQAAGRQAGRSVPGTTPGEVAARSPSAADPTDSRP
jgi:hypothetical protein